jgi:hypothetical protein
MRDKIAEVEPLGLSRNQHSNFSMGAAGGPEFPHTSSARLFSPNRRENYCSVV